MLKSYSPRTTAKRKHSINSKALSPRLGLLPPFPRMAFGVGLFQVLNGQPGVVLQGFQSLMPQQFAPTQRLANLVEGVRRWLGIGSQEAIELSGQLQRGEVAKPVQQTERVSRDWKLTPERSQRPSRGMHI
jgi:hypothetical protein